MRKTKIRTLNVFLIGLLLSLTISNMKSEATDAIETAGNILAVTLPVTAGGIALAYKDYPGILQLGESEALTIGATFGFKYTISEIRPNGQKHSFPSAHSSVSFSAAEFMRSRYGWEFGIPAYAAATFVAYSRVKSQQHHLYDVIAGGGIGFLSSYLFTTPYKGWNIKAESDGIYYGIRLSRIW